MRNFCAETIVAATFAMTALPGTAGVTSCSTAGPGNDLNNYPAGNTPTLGCGNIDLGFNNFSTGGSIFGATGDPTTLTNELVDIYSPTGPNPSGNTQGPITNNFDVPGTPTWSLIDGSVSSGASHVGYEVTVLNGTSGVNPPVTGGMWAISALGIGATYANADVPLQDSIVLHELICAGATSTTAGAGHCTSDHLATITETITGGVTPAVTFSSSSLAGTVFTFDAATGVLTASTGFTEVAIRDSVDLTAVDGTTVALTSFSNTFDQIAIPEPATFGLMGSVLSAIVALGWRRRAASLNK